MLKLHWQVGLYEGSEEEIISAFIVWDGSFTLDVKRYYWDEIIACHDINTSGSLSELPYALAKADLLMQSFGYKCLTTGA